MSNDKTFGELLAFNRSQFGISQEELAELSGVSKIQIARYETNKAKPRRKAIEKLAKALKITPEELGYRSLSQDKEIIIDLPPEAMEHLEKLAKLYDVSPDKLAYKILYITLKEQYKDKEFQKYLKDNNLKIDIPDFLLDE